MYERAYDQIGENDAPAVKQDEGQRVLGYLERQGGARTFRIATLLSVPTNAARKKMLAMEAQRLVHRDPHHSAVNDIFWRPGEGRAL